MKILLKKILEKVIIVFFVLIVIFGNILLIYNFKNKFKSINEIYSFSTKIDEANYICIKDIDDNNIIDVSEEENREKLKKFFDNIRIRESKLKLIDKEQEIDYTIFIYLPENEYFVNIKNSEIMINNKIYETDIKIDSYLSEIFEDE